MDTPLRRAIERELEEAERSRRAGNEGRARVCARRAAGMAARDFLDRRGAPAPSAYQALQQLAALPGLPADLAAAARHLTLRVTEGFTLPVETDLIAAARLLCEKLD